jgi:ArsR family transcriptional regulator
MHTQMAAQALMALGHETRLDVFRTLVQSGPEGLMIGEIQEYLNIPASTLAHHLSHLVEAGLVKRQKMGRKTYCIALYDNLQNVFDFVTRHCCEGIELNRNSENTAPLSE